MGENKMTMINAEDLFGMPTDHSESLALIRQYPERYEKFIGFSEIDREKVLDFLSGKRSLEILYDTFFRKKILYRVTSFVLFVMMLAMSLDVNVAEAALKNPREYRVELKSCSGDWLSGYYAVYDINGHEYRSDRMGTKFNQGAWDAMSEADRRKLLVNFVSARDKLDEQFGSAQVTEMFQWYEDVSGLTQSKKVLAERIAKREFPKLQFFFSDTCANRMYVELPESNYDFKDYKNLPEVQEYLQADVKMKKCYETGKSAYDVLVKSKTEQVSVAVKTLSALTIKNLICDRVFVPAISPGGLSALAPEIKGELWGLFDSLTSTTDQLYMVCGLSDCPSASDARMIINYYWKVIDYNERYSTICVDQFMYIKGQKGDLYNTAIEAIESFEKESREKEEELKKKMEEDAKNIAAIKAYFATVEELKRQGEELETEFYAWKQSLETDTNETKQKLNNIWRSYDIYSNSEADSRIVSTVNDGDFHRLQGNAYLDVGDKVPGEFANAVSQVNDRISELSTYKEDYEKKLEKYTDEWNAFEARSKGLHEAFEENGLSFGFLTYSKTIDENDNIKIYTPIDGFYDYCGRVHYTSYDPELGKNSIVPLDFDDMKKKMNDRIKVLQDRSAAWDEFAASYEDDVRSDIEEYGKYQKAVEEGVEILVDGQDKAREIDKQSNADYYIEASPDIADQEKITQYKSLLAERDNEGLKVLCDSWGSDLTERMDMWQREKARIYYGSYTVDNFKKTIMNFTTNDAYIDFLNKMGGNGLLNRTEIGNKPSGVDCSKCKTITSNDCRYPEYLSLYKSFNEFSDNNVMAYENDMYFHDILDQKPNYMRGNVTAEDLLAPYSDSSGPLLNEPGVIPEYGLYYNKYPYSSLVWCGTADMEATKGRSEAKALFDANKKGSWAYERAHGYVPVDEIKLDDDVEKAGGISMAVGEVRNLNKLVNVLPSNASDKALYWESSDIDVISLDRIGNATAVQDGTATLTVRARDSASVENEDGTVTYTPGELTFTITVGTGTPATEFENANSVWKNYGTETEPKLYDVTDLSSDHIQISLAVSSVTYEDEHIFVALYDSDGKMLDSRFIENTYEPGYRGVSMIVEKAKAAGLRIKAFAVKTDGSFAPIDGVMLLDETVS